LADYNYLY